MFAILSVIKWADIIDKAAADSLNDSFLSLCANSQSLIAVKFEIKSAQPAASNLKGDCASISESAITAIGEWAVTDMDVLGFFIDAKEIQYHRVKRL
jgi:hypothetical protein